MAMATGGTGIGVAQAQAAGEAFGPGNPFYAPSTLPFEAPPFDRIKDSDYQPAIDAGMAQQLAEVEAIANNPAPPTFENTIVAFERTGQLLNRVNDVFNCVTSANTDEELQKTQSYEAPRLAAHADAIYLNGRLFARVKAIYDERNSLHLDAESLRLVEYDYQQFVKAGANLSDADKERLKRINEEESTLENTFMMKLLAGTEAAAYTTTDASRLDGLNEMQLAAAEEEAKAHQEQGWRIPLENTTQQPVLTNLNNRATRHAIFENSWTRTERGDANDTRAIIARLAQLRAQKGALMGFPNYAAWNLTDQMAKIPQAAIDFIDALVPASTAKAAGEARDIQSLIDTQNGAQNGGTQHGGFTLEPWDWEFYAEQVRKAKYDLDESEVKPYFELNGVLQNGVFYAAHELYGLTFKERHDMPAWQKDVRVFEVFDADGKPLALWYCDYFKRDNKNGGAWMDVLVGQSKLLHQMPVVYNVANFEKPAPGQPALLTFDDVTTMFHEFGHGLHEIFADTEYPSLSGTQVPRDFVEFPSQFNEHWASYPPVLTHYARNYKTGEPMPPELIEKIQKSKTFNQGYDMTEMIAAAALDLDWHTLPASAPLQNPDTFEAQALKGNHLWISYVPPRYRSSYFLHIWEEGYQAGYYAYLWSEMLDDNAFEWFLDHGGMTRVNGDRFRRMVLSRGNTEDLQKMYDAWLGGKPSIEPMLKFRGLTDEGAK